jgi:hypothetical protein
MSMFKKLISAFETPPAPPADLACDRDELARSVVRDRSHGNVLLQDGKYYTQQDVDQENERARGFDFTPGPKDRPRG